MKTIRILGGGLSGLTAAINLKRAGIDVEVHERKKNCGKNTHDFQFFENWTFEKDALAILQDLNILTGFYIKPWYSVELISPSLKRCLKRSSRPLMYLVKRGPVEDSIDHALQKQATDANVPIIFKSKLTASDADIIATGIKEPTFIVTGITFPFDHADKAMAIFDDRLSLRIYSYFIVNDNIGEIASINPAGSKEHKVRFDLAVKRFEEILNYKISTITHRFAAPVSLYFLKQAKINNQYLIGEAAAFQDCLAGFGMMYALKSGYHAAQSIIRNDDYDRLWQADMLKTMEVSRINRFLFERLSNEGYEKVVKLLDSQNSVIVKLFGGDDLQHIFKKLYNHSLSYFLRPLVFWKRLTPIYKFILSLVGGGRC
ncbi:MAG: NAD(P)-binding protein [Desulfobacterales bacterium]|jgi:flavin-dependent dehydrogenase|nr:NAD(P)-binding protein [Desulfobacterales bacterium]